MTYAEFAERHGMRVVCVRLLERPDGDEWGAHARHWQVRLSAWGRQMAILFSQGSAHTKAPTPEDVLRCLALDSSGLDNAVDFEEWAREYGYDADSRQAHRTWRQVARQAGKLRQFAGEHLDELLHCEE